MTLFEIPAQNGEGHVPNFRREIRHQKGVIMTGTKSLVLKGAQTSILKDQRSRAIQKLFALYFDEQDDWLEALDLMIKDLNSCMLPKYHTDKIFVNRYDIEEAVNTLVTKIRRYGLH